MKDGETMTNQEIFNISVTHLRKQNAKSYLAKDDPKNTDGEMCAYRSPDGKQCAAGPLIQDDKYDPEMEGKAFFAVNQEFNLGYSSLDYSNINCNIKLISVLQSIHDREPIENWENKFEETSRIFNLVLPSTEG
jgi:hypothetical protein